MNNVFMRKIDVTENYTPLVSEKTVLTVTISAPPTNAANILFKADDGSDVPWTPGEWHQFSSINLAELQVKGTPPDVITIIGGTW